MECTVLCPYLDSERTNTEFITGHYDQQFNVSRKLMKLLLFFCKKRTHWIRARNIHNLFCVVSFSKFHHLCLPVTFTMASTRVSPNSDWLNGSICRLGLRLNISQWGLKRCGLELLRHGFGLKPGLHPDGLRLLSAVSPGLSLEKIQKAYSTLICINEQNNVTKLVPLA